jgi:hypothetical protein
MPIRTLRAARSAAALDMGLAEAQDAMRRAYADDGSLLPYHAATMAPSWLLRSWQSTGGPADALALLDMYDDYAMATDGAGFELCIDALACQAVFGDATSDRANEARRTLSGYVYAFATRPAGL